MTDTKHAKAVALRSEGHSYAAIAEALGLADKAVAHKLVNTPPPPPKTCPRCNADFAPYSSRQVYCDGCKTPRGTKHPRVSVTLDPEVFAALGVDLRDPANVSGSIVARLLREYAAVKRKNPAPQGSGDGAA